MSARVFVACWISFFGLFASTPLFSENRFEVFQPVHEYNILREYSHLGAGYGMIGEGVGYVDGAAHAPPTAEERGLFHVLAGTLDDEADRSEQDETLDFRACYQPFILPRFQPRCVGVRVRVRGTGGFKLEIKRLNDNEPGGLFALQKTWDLDNPDTYEYKTVRFAAKKIGDAKEVNWVAMPGADVWVDRLDLIISVNGNISWEERAFVASYAKLARCYSEKYGIVKDKAHSQVGEFDSVPASGLFCLATCAAADMGIVSREFALDTLRRVRFRMSKIEAYKGVLPHFVQKQGNQFVIHPGTEYSTVDTSIYYHAMLLSAHILDANTQYQLLMDEMKRAPFDGSFYTAGTRRNKYVRHGFTFDKKPLKSHWEDWGGETAIVLSWEAMVIGKKSRGGMAMDGVPDCGVGFIPEIGSLFFPDFDSPALDWISGQNWRKIRRAYFVKQVRYLRVNFPNSKGRAAGLFGLSAGEALSGDGYVVNGVDGPDCITTPLVIHPHYILLTSSLRTNSNTMRNLYERLERKGFMPPWGMVENIEVDTLQYLPMQGSLNASFESIGAYHMYAKYQFEDDVIYKAANQNSDFRDAISIFYDD